MIKIENGAAFEDAGAFIVFGGATFTLLGHADSLEDAERMAREFETPDADVIDEARIS